MFDKALESLQAKAIPYKDFKERAKITEQEIQDGGKVEVDEEYIYSFRRY